MREVLKVSAVIAVLLSLFQTYFTLIENPSMIVRFFLPMMGIGLVVYYLGRFFLKGFAGLEKRPLLQLLLLYLFGVLIGIVMTGISRGWSMTSLLLALKINLLALPLFLLILFLWRKEEVAINRALVQRQEQLDK